MGYSEELSGDGYSLFVGYSGNQGYFAAEFSEEKWGSSRPAEAYVRRWPSQTKEPETAPLRHSLRDGHSKLSVALQRHWAGFSARLFAGCGTRGFSPGFCAGFPAGWDAKGWEVLPASSACAHMGCISAFVAYIVLT